MLSACPAISLASSEARKTTAFPMSSVVWGPYTLKQCQMTEIRYFLIIAKSSFQGPNKYEEKDNLKAM